MASVFLAERVSASSAQHAWVAVKVMHPHLLSERKALERFIEEIGMTSLLKHPNICSVLDLGEHQGIPYLVMPLLKGRSLAELLELNEAPPPTVVASIWIDLARGLSYAHNLKNHEGEPLAMIHRDISPHNAFVEYSGHAKLLDFGIAKLTPPGRREETSPLMGKIAYMSPEQLEEEAVDHRIDIWSLAVTFWELCAHQPLFDAQQPMRLMYQVLSDELRAPSLHRPIPEVFDQTALAGLEREVERRPHDVLDWVKPIERWLRAELSSSAETQELGFDFARACLVAEWMEGHFDLSQDILSAQLSPEERDEHLARAREALSPLSLQRPTPFSPLHGGPSPQGLQTDDRPLSTQELPAPSPSLSSSALPTPNVSQQSLTPLPVELELDEPPLVTPNPLLTKGALFTILALGVLAALWAGGVFRGPSGPVKTLKLTVGKERKGGVMLDSSPCVAQIFLMPEHKLLGRTPHSHTLKVGVYRLRFEPLRHTRGCESRDPLIEVEEGKILRYEINLERASR